MPKKLNRDEKRALRAANLALFIKSYGRQSQKGVEPNDRQYSREEEEAIKRLRPEELDALLRDDEDS